MRKYLLGLAAALAVVGPTFAQVAVPAVPAPVAPTPAVTAPAPAPLTIATPAPVATPKTVEERLALLEKAVSDIQKTMEEVVKVVNTHGETLQNLDQNAGAALRGLARDVVSLQDQITAMRRASIPPPKTTPKAAPRK